MRPHPEPPAAALLRRRIAILLRDPAVARRVARRLDSVAEATAIGTPPCFRAAEATRPSSVVVRIGRCRDHCRSVDCLCGRYPRTLSDREIENGRHLEQMAV
jgi:hypothetical protein